MKLIIDVPEEYYKSAKLMVEKGSTYPLKVSIANGIPLDDVKAELESVGFTDLEGDTYIYVPYAFEILDNIGKAESEEVNGV